MITKKIFFFIIYLVCNTISIINFTKKLSADACRGGGLFHHEAAEGGGCGGGEAEEVDAAGPLADVELMEGATHRA